MIDKGFKIRRIAEKSGMGEDVLGSITRCKRRVYADELIPISLALEVDVSELVATKSSA
jgi:hypothetical protein